MTTASPLLQLSALGTVLPVDLTGTRLDPEEFRLAWSRCLVGEGTPATAEPLKATETSMAELTQSITRAFISSRLGELLMLHAGALCHPGTGSALVYVAPGGTGKTTLSATFGERYGYLTDETVGIEPHTWQVLAYPKPLSMRPDDGTGPKDEVSPDTLGLAPCAADPHVTSLVLLQRDEDAEAPRPEPLDLLDAVASICEQSSSIHLLQRPLHLLEALIADVGGVERWRYREAHTLTNLVTDRLGEP